MLKILIPALALLAACGGSDPQPASSTSTAPTAELTLLTEGPPDTLVPRLTDLVAGPEGFWATTVGEYQLVGYDSLGRSTGGILRRGQGPDDVERLHSVSPGLDGGAVVWDSWRGRVLSVDPSGHITGLRRGAVWKQPYLGATKLLLGGRLQLVAQFPHDVLVAGVLGDSTDAPDFYNDMALVLDSAGTQRTLWSFERSATWLDSMPGKRAGLSPFPLWGPCGDASVAIYEPYRDQISWVALDGTVFDSMATTTPPYTMGHEDKVAVGFWRLRQQVPSSMTDAQLRDMMKKEITDEEINGVISRYPSYTTMQCSPAGTVLLERPVPPMAQLPLLDAWELYTRGQPVREFFVPTNWQRPTFDGDGLAAIALDSLDVPHIVRVGIP